MSIAPEVATRFGTLTPGTWAIDPSHTEVGFVARHLMVTKVRGRFAGVAGTVTVGDDLGGSAVEVTVRWRRSTPAAPTATPTCAAPTSSTSRTTR